jgi:transposase, IS5 family
MQLSFFDLENRYNHLSKSGDPLERLNRAIDWELFRSTLEQVDNKERKSGAGRKPTDRVRMFKMLILQSKYNLSDEQLEYQVTDRLSFARFIGVDLSGGVPDAKTVWAFRDALKEEKLWEGLLLRFEQALLELGVKLNSGQIIDASFVPVPIQRNKSDENERIKAGETPEQWGAQAAKLRQKDVDARWTKKGSVSHYGYKNHVNVDAATKLITAHTTTSAQVHDSQELNTLVRPAEQGGKTLHADSAYRSEDAEGDLAQRGIESQIHERAYRNQPLSAEQKASNTIKSKVRARVEHVFGAMENSMGGMHLRSIGLARAKVGVALKNLTYNLCRVEVLIRQKVFDFSRLTTPEMGLAG